MPASQKPKKRQLEELACVYPNAAGLDIGSAEIVVAVGAHRDAEPVRVFATFTPDLHTLVAWLLSCGIDTVAMESTGVFWIPIYELLEAAGITPYLVNARHVKTVPGRKLTGMTRSGCKGCMPLVCFRPRSVPTPKSVRFEHWFATVPSLSSDEHHTSTI